jgi:hypothetical protein
MSASSLRHLKASKLHEIVEAAAVVVVGGEQDAANCTVATVRDKAWM